jgi:hypothetical protein
MGFPSVLLDRTFIFQELHLFCQRPVELVTVRTVVNSPVAVRAERYDVLRVVWTVIRNSMNVMRLSVWPLISPLERRGRTAAVTEPIGSS